MSDVLERSWAGEDLVTVSEEFGVPVAELEDVLRVASRRLPDLFLDRSLGRVRVLAEGVGRPSLSTEREERSPGWQPIA